MFNWLKTLWRRKPQPPQEAPEPLVEDEPEIEPPEIEDTIPEEVPIEESQIGEPEEVEQAEPEEVEPPEIELEEQEIAEPEELPIVPPVEVAEPPPIIPSIYDEPIERLPPPEEPVIHWPPRLDTGGGITHHGSGVIMGSQEPDEGMLLDNDGIWAEITASAVADSPAQNRWTYSWKEKCKATAGYDGWSDVSGGMTGTNNAYNIIEDMNTASDASSPTVQGNGVDIDGTDFPAGFAVKAAPDGVTVKLHMVSVGSTVEYWFAYENAIDGTCEAP